MKLQQSFHIGNLVDIRQAGQIKILVLSSYNFNSKKDDNKPSDYYEIKVFPKQMDKIADLEQALADRRAETGNEKSALKNVKLSASHHKDANGATQLALLDILHFGPKTEVAEEVADAK